MYLKKMHHKDTTWNQHGGVGATLLDNWVEERAVGSDRILKERDVRYISERGHADILIQDRMEDPRQKFLTVCQSAYQPPSFPFSSSRSSTQSVRKTMKEKKWLEQDIVVPTFTSPPLPKVYQSMTQAAYSKADFEPSLSIAKPPPLSVSSIASIPEHPITFWSHFHDAGAHTVYGSTPRGTGQGEYLERFGKHVTFSTPIAENLKGAQKP